MTHVSYEEALQLKEQGFDREVISAYFYDKTTNTPDRLINPLKKYDNWSAVGIENEIVGYVSAPTYAEALDWIREVKGIKCAVELVKETNRFGGLIGYQYGGAYIGESKNEVLLEPTDDYPLAEQALFRAVLTYLIERKP